MHFYEKIKNLSKENKLIIFVDMDGVIASYDFGKPLDFLNKRPLLSNINTLRKISKLDNVELHILSICRFNYQQEEKNKWLDIYAPFFEKEKRTIISKESNPGFLASQLKANYLNSLSIKDKIVLIDDDNEVLRTIHRKDKDIILYQDSELID